ncbi:MAG: hypothetical protein ND807_08200 [Vicinamibacterales bacterium]|nr:hypothetical protein [Vicinamibacterales bacterium]
MSHALLLAAMVVIRSYNYADVPPDELARARATADRVFQQAGISLQWIDCWVPDRPSSIVDRRSSGCNEPLRDGSEFVLRLMSSDRPVPPASTTRLAMGSSLIDHDSGSGALTTVDPALVTAIARSASAEYSTLLGRAMAHELGHLLLGHAHHSTNGLMRAIWSQDEIRGIRPAGWQFSRGEAAQMRQGLASRSRAAN